MIQGLCRKYRSCRARNGHDGSCYDRNGNLIPKNKPVTVIKVISRDTTGVPEKSGKYHV